MEQRLWECTADDLFEIFFFSSDGDFFTAVVYVEYARNCTLNDVECRIIDCKPFSPVGFTSILLSKSKPGVVNLQSNSRTGCYYEVVEVTEKTQYRIQEFSDRASVLRNCIELVVKNRNDQVAEAETMYENLIYQVEEVKLKINKLLQHIENIKDDSCSIHTTLEDELKKLISQFKGL